ncbi:hypothetical protein ANN_17825 [Periplaneta americana]|uniref:PiggyBac transposable element-derived protein domain-containing protein n=1 Tax=Periplaneta americana TaxID=6978 RepID=A0ABQ8SU15_PERAM|nr:hypothetical protein ANN_17825 [Periplaneta americana]
MGGIDRGDQNVSLYRTSIRGKKWYFPIIAHLIDVAEQNAWLLYRCNEENVDHLYFRRRVATAILESKKRVLTSKGRPSKVSRIESRYDGRDHYVSDLPVDIHTHTKKQLKCRIYQKKKQPQCASSVICPSMSAVLCLFRPSEMIDERTLFTGLVKKKKNIVTGL